MQFWLQTTLLNKMADSLDRDDESLFNVNFDRTVIIFCRVMMIHQQVKY